MAKQQDKNPVNFQPDLSYAQAAQVIPGLVESLAITLVGCGGTGGWLAPSLARLARLRQDEGREVRMNWIDPDTVEAVNIPRQNFCEAELGRNKAVTLAARYATAWGVEITARPERFTTQHLTALHGWCNLLIGCVDNAAARKQLALAAIASNRSVWWLDCGNTEQSGQVLLGNTGAEGLKDAFLSKRACTRLPWPSLVAPDLLTPRPEEARGRRISCAEQAAANAQSLSINQVVAGIAFDYLLQLLSGQLRSYATYVDLAAYSMRSLYVTPEEIAVYRKSKKKSRGEANGEITGSRL